MLSGLRRGVRVAVMPKFEPELHLETLEKYKVMQLHELLTTLDMDYLDFVTIP